MTDSSVVDRLANHRTVGGVPREELEWLARNGHSRTLEVGEMLTTAGLPVAGLYVVFKGHLTIRIDRGAGPRVVLEWHGGDVAGLLPYSRMKAAPGNVIAEEPTEIFVLPAADIPRMISECFELTAVMVHVMVDRARVFNSSEAMDEKLVSLGRMAAGLAHELNNPASAVARSAKRLVSELNLLDEATKRFCQLNLSDTQCFSISALREERPPIAAASSPLEAADREEALEEWLDERGVSGVEVEPLAASAFAPADLDSLSAAVGIDKMAPVLSHIATGQNVRRLVSEISMAAERIHALVDAVKGFTHMDQETMLEPIEIGRGLSDTITVMASKARAKNVDVSLEVAPDLPLVEGYGGELNQVWANLLDNAIDATPNGHVRVLASVPIDKVVVRIIDDGPGIPKEVKDRVFDPFFTTKKVGEGTGMGLDIARRIVHRHHGVIDIHTDANGTEFRITLPVSSSTATR